MGIENQEQSPMPHSRSILNADLIPKQNLRARATFPAPIAGGRKHELTSGINVDGAEYAASMTGDDGEGDSRTIAVRRVAGGEIVDAEDVLAGAVGERYQ